MKYRWITKKVQTYKNKTYVSYVVRINSKHLFSSSILKFCENYVVIYAQKNGINYNDILKKNKT